MGHNHKNYHKFSENQNNSEIKNEVPVKELNPLSVEAEETVTDVFDNVINDIIIDVPKIEEVKGYLTNCYKLNVRAEANKDAAVLCILEDNAELIIDLNNSTEEFYKVCTSAGVEGYCMKKFIAVK